MTVFAAGVAALFRDPNLSTPVLWGPDGAAPSVPLRAMRRAPDQVANFGQSRAMVPALTIDLRVSDVPGIVRGDLITMAGDTFRVATAPLRDREGLVLTVELVPE